MEKCGFTDTGMLNRCSQLVGGDKDMVSLYIRRNDKVYDASLQESIVEP